VLIGSRIFYFSGTNTGSGNHQVSVLDVTVSGCPSTLVSGASADGGFANGLGNVALYSAPSGAVFVAAWGPSGSLIIADTGNNALRRLDLVNYNTTTVVGARGVTSNANGVGTSASFSSPIVTGVIAATMSQGGPQNLSGTAALSAMNSNLIDIAEPGGDTATGAGVPDMWGIFNGNTPGIYDAAVTSITISRSQVQALVQNLGTETLVNAGVSVRVNGVTTNANITTLAPGDTRVIAVPTGGVESLNIQGSVRLSTGQADQRPSNDSISQSSTAP
jgi:hypothetical protein